MRGEKWWGICDLERRDERVRGLGIGKSFSNLVVVFASTFHSIDLVGTLYIWWKDLWWWSPNWHVFLKLCFDESLPNSKFTECIFVLFQLTSCDFQFSWGYFDVSYWCALAYWQTILSSDQSSMYFWIRVHEDFITPWPSIMWNQGRIFSCDTAR